MVGTENKHNMDVTVNNKQSIPKWRVSDMIWVLSLYGTAIGAGVLFLPINARAKGIDSAASCENFSFFNELFFSPSTLPICSIW